MMPPQSSSLLGTDLADAIVLCCHVHQAGNLGAGDRSAWSERLLAPNCRIASKHGLKPASSVEVLVMSKQCIHQESL